MNGKRERIVILSVIATALCAQNAVFAQSGLSKKIAEGNTLYNDGKYDKALVKYNDAQIEAPRSPEIYFNMGNVFFRQGKYKEAIDSYQKSMEKGDTSVEAKAMYNIGNSLFQQGQLREALEYYKQALERDPDDIDTKYNIEYTERMIKEMLSKAEQTKKEALGEQQRRKKQEQKNARGSQEGKEKKQQEGQKKAASGEETKKEEAKKNKQDTVSVPAKEKETGSEKKEGSERRVQGAKGSAAADTKDLSKEDAERFLSAFERDQKNRPLANQQRTQKGRGYYVEKDW